MLHQALLMHLAIEDVNRMISRLTEVKRGVHVVQWDERDVIELSLAQVALLRNIKTQELIDELVDVLKDAMDQDLIPRSIRVPRYTNPAGGLLPIKTALNSPIKAI